MKLRAYQQEAVQKTISYFKTTKAPGVLVLPTGAGKSVVIAALAQKARGRVLILAHVKELVEQNYLKFKSFETQEAPLSAGIYSAGLDQKNTSEKVIFGSIQSVALIQSKNEKDNFKLNNSNNQEISTNETFYEQHKIEIYKNISLVIIDECHRVSQNENTQYQNVIFQIKKQNPEVCILGLTATPYRLGYGWIYQNNLHLKEIKTDSERFFKNCIYELSLKYLIQEKYLTEPVIIKNPTLCYNFSELTKNYEIYHTSDIEKVLKDQSRLTPMIVKNILDHSKDRKGVMIFTSSLRHAEEIYKLLPEDQTAFVSAETPLNERDRIILDFKNFRIKYLVNVSVLTTGFDAPHVDVIALLRPTESVSLYQQIIGRGLRLFDNKKNCLVLDYSGQSYNIYDPEIEKNKDGASSTQVEITCPKCEKNQWVWGKLDEFGEIQVHYARKCNQLVFKKNKTNLALEENIQNLEPCGFLFRFKRCPECQHENDIAARVCQNCKCQLTDNDQKLKEARKLPDCHVMKVDSMHMRTSLDKNKNERLEVIYLDVNGDSLKEFYYINTQKNHHFYFNFYKLHIMRPELKYPEYKSISEIKCDLKKFKLPLYVIARKENKFWNIKEKLFWI